jgi:hypothetical protein
MISFYIRAAFVKILKFLKFSREKIFFEIVKFFAFQWGI